MINACGFVKKGNTYLLLVRVKIGATTMEISVEVAQKAQNST